MLPCHILLSGTFLITERENRMGRRTKAEDEFSEKLGCVIVCVVFGGRGLRSRADIRNAVAHGEWQKFNRQDVAMMLAGVNSVVAEML